MALCAHEYDECDSSIFRGLSCFSGKQTQNSRTTLQVTTSAGAPRDFAVRKVVVLPAVDVVPDSIEPPFRVPGRIHGANLLNIYNNIVVQMEMCRTARGKQGQQALKAVAHPNHTLLKTATTRTTNSPHLLEIDVKNSQMTISWRCSQEKQTQGELRHRHEFMPTKSAGFQVQLQEISRK